ncbi:Putative regulatory protein EP146_15640, partial [Dysosmobacter welbionis]
EAATAVLGTELFEQLPSEEVTVTEASAVPAKRSVFAKVPQQRQIRKKLMRQFLCFSDSRSEAAFFASYMERSYQEFLRRRGI